MYLYSRALEAGLQGPDSDPAEGFLARIDGELIARALDEARLLDELKAKLRRLDAPESAIAKVRSVLAVRRPGPPTGGNGPIEP